MLLIQNAYLINPADSREGICDIAIGNGKFLAIETSITPEQAAALAAGLEDGRTAVGREGRVCSANGFRDFPLIVVGRYRDVVNATVGRERTAVSGSYRLIV